MCRLLYPSFTAPALTAPEHPPLGQLIIASGIKCFGDNPFGWRFFSVLFGIAGVAIFYLICLSLQMKAKYAFIAAFLLSFENLSFVQSGIAMLDVFSLTFMLGSLWLYLHGRYNLAGISAGLATLVKLSGILVLLLIVLQRFRQKGHAPLWLIPPLFCLWVNTHGSWLIGMVIFSTVIGAGLFQGEWGFIAAEPWTPSQRNRLLLAWSVSLGALFVNPFGARLVFYPLDLAFRQKLNIEHVAEWVSVNFHDTRG